MNWTNSEHVPMAKFNYCIPLKGGKGKVTFKGSGAKGGSAKDARARGVLCSKDELKSGKLIQGPFPKGSALPKATKNAPAKKAPATETILERIRREHAGKRLTSTYMAQYLSAEEFKALEDEKLRKKPPRKSAPRKKGETANEYHMRIMFAKD